jgi:uncharacterized protein (DUF2062 family)
MTNWYRVFPFGKSERAAALARLMNRLPKPESLRHGWLHRWFGDRIFHPDLWMPSRSSLAMGLAIGWFFGLLPVFGLQIALALVCGLYFRGHFPTAVLGTFISNPLTTPGILVVQYGFGQWILRRFRIDNVEAAPLLHHGIPFGLGSLASACAFALLGYLGAWLVWGWTGRSRLGGLRASESAS